MKFGFEIGLTLAIRLRAMDTLDADADVEVRNRIGFTR